MNIIYFHQHFSTPKGMSGIRSYAMAQGLIRKGHQVTMVCGSYSGGSTGLKGKFTKGKREGFVDGIHIVEFSLPYANSDNLLKRSLLFFNFAIKGVILALTQKYDILFASTTPLTAGIPGIFAKWFRGKPFVFEVRDLWPELPKAMKVIKNPFILSAMSILELVSYRCADRCIGLSPGIVGGINNKGVSKDNIALIPNGCDLDIFSKRFKKWRPDGVKLTDFMAVFTGTHGVANGLESLIDVAIELKDRQINHVKLVLVGQGKLKPYLQNMAKANKLDNIIFHDSVSKVKLSGLMADADLGMQILANIPAFYYGTSPNKFFDYISAGLPVINNYPGWLAELITDNQCGYVVPPNNPKLFVDALKDASSDRSKLQTMSENSIQLAKKKFDRKNLADIWVDWVIGVIN